jgi:hypothetical protein
MTAAAGEETATQLLSTRRYHAAVISRPQTILEDPEETKGTELVSVDGHGATRQNRLRAWLSRRLAQRAAKEEQEDMVCCQCQARTRELNLVPT